MPRSPRHHADKFQTPPDPSQGLMLIKVLELRGRKWILDNLSGYPLSGSFLTR